MFCERRGVDTLVLGRAPSEPKRRVAAIGVRVVADVEVGTELRGRQVEAAAERGILAALGAGCNVAVGAYAEIEGDLMTVRAMLGGDVEGEAPVFGEATGRGDDAEGLGRGLGERLQAGYVGAGGSRL